MLSARYFSPFWWGEVLRARTATWVTAIGFQPKVVRKRIEGVECDFFLANPTGAVWYGRTLDHENLEMRFARERMIRPGMTILEVGGHHGHDTIPLATWTGPAGHVITVEPLPENVSVIHENLRLNALGNVTVIAAALGATSGSAKLKQTSNGSIATGESGVGIDVLSVDDLCARVGRWPDLIKMDVEGYEIDVLLGATQALARRPALHIELHHHALPKFGRKPADLWALFETAAYDLWLQDDDLAPPRPIDGPVPTTHRCHIFAIPKAVS